MQPERQPTCAEIVEERWQSRREDLRLMLTPTPEDVELIDDGTLDTVLRVGYDDEFRYSDVDREDPDWLDDLIANEWDQIVDDLADRFHGHGLSFDYVAPGTFREQERGYFRYQISYGGPSQELRFWVDERYQPYHIEFWHLDWFDGACEDVTNDEVAQLVWQWYEDFAQDVKERDDI